MPVRMPEHPRSPSGRRYDVVPAGLRLVDVDAVTGAEGHFSTVGATSDASRKTGRTTTANIPIFRYKCCMSGETISRLGAIAAERWGMITTAQAVDAGVPRKVLSGLVASGAIERLAQGVYRMAGAPAAEHEVDVVRVRWLALGGVTRHVVAAGRTAAALHGIGDWFPAESEFVTPNRRTTRLSDVRLRMRRVDEEDIVYVDGLPAMTVERTIADLVEAREDPSLMADALRHAVQRGTFLRPRRLAQLLESLAHRNGEASGAALAGRLILAGGVDESWLDRLH